MQQYVLWYQELGMGDVNKVGGKNASLGEMISNLANAGVQVPGGFATTAHAFNEFLEQSGVNQKIYDILDTLDVDDVNALAKVGAQIRQWVIETPSNPNSKRPSTRPMTNSAARPRMLPSPYVPLPPPKTCLMPLLPVSRKPS